LRIIMFFNFVFQVLAPSCFYIIVTVTVHPRFTFSSSLL
jgi:hypothetical protein